MQRSPMRPPVQLRIAVALLLVVALLNHSPRTLPVITGILSGRIEGESVFYKSLDELLLWGASLVLIALIAWGCNWARWLNAGLAVLNFAFNAVRLATTSEPYGIAAPVLAALVATLDFVALYLLFRSPGRDWFKR
jgi:hypothetical protein